MSVPENLCYLRAGLEEKRDRRKQSREAAGLHTTVIFFKMSGGGKISGCCDLTALQGWLCMPEGGQVVASSPFKPVLALGKREFA